MRIIQNRKKSFALSGALIILSAACLAVFGLNLGIDFTGGSLLEVRSDEPLEAAQIEERIADLDLGEVSVLPTGQGTWILRMKEISEDLHQEVLERLIPASEEGSAEVTGLEIEQIEGDNDMGIEIGSPVAELAMAGEELRFDSIGPSIGAELKEKSVYAMLFVLLAIILYIAWAFRKVSKPISSWKYGIVAIVALFHDVFIVVGLFALFGHFLAVEVNTPFVAALLTILGYSVNDTIVVFDRIRENLKGISSRSFEEVVNDSVNQTVRRSINTSATTALVLLSLYFFGGETIQYFVLTLLIGVIVGTYSSIFLASPLLVAWERRRK